jgi:hypothetical protein
MISPKWIFCGAIITSFLLSIFLYNLTASAFSNPINIQGKTYENDNKNNQTTSQSINGSDSQIIANNILEDSSCLVSNRFPQDILRWCELITQNAIEQGLDANLLAALILQESAGDPLAYSHSGAVGLMQVMPRDGIASNFICKNGPCFTDRPPIEDLQKPNFNIAYGSKMLSNLISRHGSVREALKSYGPMDVGYEYSDIVINLYNRYKN